MTLSNIAAMNAADQTNAINLLMGSSLEKLTTGLQINKSSDDVSGLAIADKLRTQQTSLTQSIANGNSANALIDIADKSLENSGDLLDDIKAKLIQASTATTSDEGREAIRKDISKLLEQIDNTAKNTTYNGVQLLATASGAATTSLTFQMGEKSTSTIETDGSVQANSEGLSLDGLRDLASGGLTAAAATTAIDTLDTAITTLNGWRSDFGSTQNQITSSIENMISMNTNIADAESVIRDVDYEQETINYNKLNIQAQAGSFAISQANAMQQNILRLLQ